ncbi:DUF4349 domain-containing protein [Humibacter sp. BT305]|nr:DUF4349 domain-containing protein [Humibacter sp. BT305]
MTGMRRLPVLAAIVAGVLLLSGCSASSSQSSSSGGGGIAQEGGPAPAPGDRSGAADGSATSDVQASGQKVVTTGWVTITTDDPVASAERVVQLVEQLDGRIDSRNQQAGAEGQPASAQLTLRVPADQVDQALEELKDIGSIDSVSLTADDVTLQSRDLDAQITALRASIDRLLALVGNAATTSDLIELETAISDRQTQLDSLTAQKQYLDDQVAYSTITLTLQTPAAVPEVVAGDFWSGLAAGWASLTTAAAGFLVVLGVLLPWLVLAGIVVTVVLLLVRLRRRRRAARVATGVPVAPPAPHHPNGTFPVAPRVPAPSASSQGTAAAPAAGPTAGAPAATATVDPAAPPAPSSDPEEGRTDA